jgi:hypothetical protein
MSLKQDKEKIFNSLSSLKTLNELPSNKKNNSLESLRAVKNVKKINNAFEFVSDLLITFKGSYGQIKILKELTTNKIKEFEDELKKSLIFLLKDIGSCSMNPSLPDDFLHQTINPLSNGIKIKLKLNDLTNIFKIDINSDNGKLFFSDIVGGINSTDFNTFLYNVIQTPNVEQEWGQQVNVDPILSVTFIPNDGIDVNYLLIRASQFYSNPTNNKTLIDVNHDLINSLKLLEVNILLNYLIDFTFGSVSKAIKKTQSEIEVEEVLNSLIEKVVNSEEDEKYEDEFFNFTNEEIETIAKKSLERSKGKLVIDSSNSLIANLPMSEIIKTNDLILSGSSTSEKFNTVRSFYDNLDSLVNMNTFDGIDKDQIKISISSLMVKNLIKSVMNVIISPKVLTLIILNYKIIDGNGNQILDIVDLIKKNRTLIIGLIKKIINVVVKKYLAESIKEIVKLVNQDKLKETQEKYKNYKEVINSFKKIDINSLSSIKNLIL